MRKSVLLGCLLLAAVASSEVRAQWSVRPEVGMTAVAATKVYGHEHWNPSWRLGVGVDYQLPNELWALSSGVFFTERPATNMTHGFTSTYSMIQNGHITTMLPPDAHENPYTWFYSGRNKRVATSFYVPLMVKRIIPLSSELKLSAAVGPYLGYCFHNKIRDWDTWLVPIGEGLTEEDFRNPDFGKPYNDSVSYFDWGFLFQAGLEIRKWTVTAGYELSMQSRYFGTIQNGEAKDYFHTVSFSIGYKFNLGK